MDPINAHHGVRHVAPATAANSTLPTPASTPATAAAYGGGGMVPVGSCSHGGGAVGAAHGSELVARGPALAQALERLKAVVAELQRTIEAWSRTAAAGGGGCGAMGGTGAAGGSTAVGDVSPVTQSPVQGGGPAPTSATARTSAIPETSPGQSEQLRLARGQVTYRQIPIVGGATGTTVQIPATSGGVSVEVFALRDYQRGAHRTQVLEPVSGSVTVPAGETVKLVARIKGVTPGDHVVDVAGARLDVHVGTQSIDALPMMAWVNEADARKRGAGAADVSSVLAHFGIASTGASGVTVTSASNRSPVQYFSVAYEAATKQSPADAARRIIEAERRAGAASPGSAFWVQVSDEQDRTAGQVAGTVSWIAELRRHLQAGGSNAKLFVATQARPENLGYASVIDGWATTQSAAGRNRETAIADIRRASAAYGRPIELLEYPGNAFFDAGTPGGAAISTASAALDGASSWFLYSANNLSVLEEGKGIEGEGRGDIGGLVAIEGGRVLPTIALIEAELGANLGAAARAYGATGTSGASQVAYTSDRLDAYRHTGTAPDLRLWEAEIGQRIG